MVTMFCFVYIFCCIEAAEGDSKMIVGGSVNPQNNTQFSAALLGGTHSSCHSNIFLNLTLTNSIMLFSFFTRMCLLFFYLGDTTHRFFFLILNNQFYHFTQKSC